MVSTSSLALAYNSSYAIPAFWSVPMLLIRFAKAGDAPVLTKLIRELAEYDKLSHETVVTEEDVARDGFGDRPKFRALIAEWNGQIA